MIVGGKVNVKTMPTSQNNILKTRNTRIHGNLVICLLYCLNIVWRFLIGMFVNSTCKYFVSSRHVQCLLPQRSPLNCSIMKEHVKRNITWKLMNIWKKWYLFQTQIDHDVSVTRYVHNKRKKIKKGRHNKMYTRNRGVLKCRETCNWCLNLVEKI